MYSQAWEKRKGVYLILTFLTLWIKHIFFEMCTWHVGRRVGVKRDLTWKVIIKVESSLVAWFGGVRARVYCHGNFTLSDVSEQRNIEGDNPWIKQDLLWVDWDEQDQAVPTIPAAPMLREQWEGILSLCGAGLHFSGFHLQMNSCPWWKCWGARATMKGIHREMQFVNQLVC